MEQSIDYEWLPVKCKNCTGFGHITADCRKDTLKKKALNPNKQQPNLQQVASTKLGEVQMDASSKEPSQVPKSVDINIDKSWQTPKKTEQGKVIDKQDVVAQFCQVNKIGVEALLEIKLKGNKIKEMFDSKMSNWNYYTSDTIEGRLLIYWRKNYARVIVTTESPKFVLGILNQDLNLLARHKTQQFVHCYVKLASCEYGFCATFVYGINTIDKRKSLWEDLLKLKMVVKPWVVLGDFNAIINIDDRVGGNSITFNDTHDASMWLATANVEVIPRAGSSFTWSNNQDGTSRIYSKIDHVFANEDWLDEFPNAEALFRWETIFDHCSCIVRSVISNKIGFKPFKYYNLWSSHPEFKETVLISWKKPITAKGVQAIYLKLMRLKHCLRKFIHNLIGDIGKKFQEAKSDFIEPRMQAQAHLKEARFLDKEKKGEIVDNYLEVVNHFVSHFQGAEICFVVKDFFISGSMPKELHSALISLVPKISSRAGDFRPIACCSTIYECNSKLLCTRLVVVLPRLINQNKGAFIQDRSIAHNVMILQDLLKNYNRKNISPRCSIKINISKAYDNVSWDFLEQLLVAYNFPQKFI
ncbi:hypothetical protein CsatB_019814 [Cannabis sativa]